MLKKSKKYIIILGITLLIVGIIILLLVLRNRNDMTNSNKKIKEPSNLVVDIDDSENVIIDGNLKINDSEDIKNKVYATSSSNDPDNSIYIDDVSLTADIDTDECVFSGKLYNVSGKDIKRLFINITFYTSDDMVIGNFETNVENIKNNDSSKINFNSEDDISNAKYYKIDYSILE